jgi:hypothetical protein
MKVNMWQHAMLLSCTNLTSIRKAISDRKRAARPQLQQLANPEMAMMCLPSRESRNISTSYGIQWLDLKYSDRISSVTLRDW